ncbi:MAG: hypothetical protein Q8N88_00930 [Nanoarchaeota archaeon]|nr:hypothetical protein [Nanoarchaeota archaeon]
MKNYFKTLLLLAFISTQKATAQEKFFKSATFDTRVASQYLAGRAGFVVEDEPVVQNYLDVSSNAGTFYCWSNSKIDEKDLSEVDLGWISPPVSKDYIGTNFCVSGFTFPNTSNTWKDFEAGLNIFSKNLPLGINYYGAVNYSNGYLSKVQKLSLGRGFSFEDFNIEFDANLVYSNGYYSKNHGFTHGTIGAKLSKKISNGLEFYVGTILQKELGSKEKVRNDVMVYTGLKLRLK